MFSVYAAVEVDDVLLLCDLELEEEDLEEEEEDEISESIALGTILMNSGET